MEAAEDLRAKAARYRLWASREFNLEIRKALQALANEYELKVAQDDGCAQAPQQQDQRAELSC